MNEQALIDIARTLVNTGKGLLARYAALCQEAGLVPVVEPEVLMDGDHPLERCREVTMTRSPLPWALTFSFGRAIQQPALGIWGGRESQRSEAQQALLHRAHCNPAATRGEYTAEMEPR